MTALAEGRTDREAAAIDLLAALYPEPCTVLVAPDGMTPVRAGWTAIPSAANPRLLVPDTGRAAAARTVRRQLTGRRLRTRAARAGLSLAVASGALARLPRLRVAVAGPGSAPSIEDPLRRVLGVEELALTLPIGPPRSNRKPVLQVTDRSGRVLAFAKVGHLPLTRRLVRREREALLALEDARPDGVRFPRLLASLTWSGHDVVVLEPLAVPTRRLTGQAARRRLLALVRELAAVGGVSVVDWGAHPYRADLLERAGRCGDLAAPLRRQVERLPARQPVATGSWHGDLNAGNLALVAGPCPVWDWERFESGVPVGFDLLHHDLHRSITERGGAPRAAATRLLDDAARTLAPLGVDPAGADVVARGYLVTLACRYLADDQAGAGGELGRVHEWLVPALEGARP
jgi:hypothetical protein